MQKQNPFTNKTTTSLQSKRQTKVRNANPKKAHSERDCNKHIQVDRPEGDSLQLQQGGIAL